MIGTGAKAAGVFGAISLPFVIRTGSADYGADPIIVV